MLTLNSNELISLKMRSLTDLGKVAFFTHQRYIKLIAGKKVVLLTFGYLQLKVPS